MSQQPYAPPADDGGDQGAFTLPQSSLAQPNTADPQDRTAAGSLWTGVKDDRRAGAEDKAERRWISFGAVWKAQALILLMVLLFSALALVGGHVPH